MQRVNKNIARIQAICASIIWGTSFVVIRLGLIFIPTFEFLFFRFFLATMFFLPYMLIRKTTWRFVIDLFKDPKMWILAFFNAIGFIFQFLGQEITLATTAAILVNTNVIFVALLSHLILNEKLNKTAFVGIFISFIGTIIMTTNLIMNTIMFHDILGNLLCLASSISWALYIVLSKKFYGERDKDPISIVFLWIFMTALYLAPIVIIRLILGFTRVYFDSLIIAIALYIAFFCTFLAFILWFNSLRILKATVSSLYFLTEIIVSALLEMYLFSSIMSTIQIAGGILIVAGILITDVSMREKRIENEKLL